MGNVVFNKERLQFWRQVDNENWKTIATEIIEVFEVSGRSQMIEVNEAWSNRNREALRKAAHKFKSSCGNVGAESAFSMLETIELESLEMPPEEIDGILDRLNVVISETFREIQNFKMALSA